MRMAAELRTSAAARTSSLRTSRQSARVGSSTRRRRPNLPTTMPAAAFASCAASADVAPAAIASASVATTVSPAPVTSATSRAVGRQVAFDAVGREPHAVLAHRDQHARRTAPARERRPRRARASSFVRMRRLRRHLRFVMVRRDQRGAGVVSRVRDLRIDEHRDAVRLARSATSRRHQPPRDEAL